MAKWPKCRSQPQEITNKTTLCVCIVQSKISLIAWYVLHSGPARITRYRNLCILTHNMFWRAIVDPSPSTTATWWMQATFCLPETTVLWWPHRREECLAHCGMLWSWYSVHPVKSYLLSLPFHAHHHHGHVPYHLGNSSLGLLLVMYWKYRKSMEKVR